LPAGTASERERRHLWAARAWLERDLKESLQLYGDIAADDPLDIDWLQGTSSAWTCSVSYAPLLWWHQALCHLDLDDIDATLRILGARLPTGHTAGAPALVDALQHRHLAQHCGGSRAQCDLVQQTLLEERIAARPHSEMNQRLIRRCERRDRRCRPIAH
jgi:hypothetical protein